MDQYDSKCREFKDIVDKNNPYLGMFTCLTNFQKNPIKLTSGCTGQKYNLAHIYNLLTGVSIHQCSQCLLGFSNPKHLTSHAGSKSSGAICKSFKAKSLKLPTTVLVLGPNKILCNFGCEVSNQGDVRAMCDHLVTCHSREELAKWQISYDLIFQNLRR